MKRLLALALLLTAPSLLVAAPVDAAEPPGAPPGADGPLTLEQAVATALAHQPQLRAARAHTRGAQARTDEARAALLPSVTGSAGWSRGTKVGFPTGDTASYGLTGKQPLFDANSWYGASAARSLAEAQGQTEQATRLAVILSVRTAWYQAAAARDLVAVAKETLANREEHLAQVKAFVEVGTRPEIDLFQARADRASAVVQLIGAENDLATAHAQLNQAMGVAASTDYALAAAEPASLAGEDGTIDALLAEALTARPDAMARQRTRDAEIASLRATQSGFLPSVGLTGSIGETGPAFDETRRSWSAGVGLTWTLLEGGLTAARVREARAALDQLDAEDEAFQQGIRLELEQARLAVRSARASLEASGEVVLNARERLRLADARYRAGLGSGLELSDAQVALNNAAAQEVKARFALGSARASLAKALGRG